MNTSEPQIITVRPSSKRTELNWLLGLLLLASVAGYLHWTLGEILAWWLLMFLVILLSLVLIGLGLWLWRAHSQSKSRARLEQEYLRQEQERTAGLELSRLKAEAELQEAKAKANKAEREAEFSYVKTGLEEGLWVRELNPHAVWQPLHRNPRHRINGVAYPPSLLELATWEQWHNGRHTPLPSPMASVARWSCQNG